MTVDIADGLRGIGVCASREALLALLAHATKGRLSPGQVVEQIVLNFAPVGDAGARTELLAGLDRARKKIGELKITSLRGATIEVNGAVIGTAPLVAAVFVDAENQFVTAKRGRRRQRKGAGRCAHRRVERSARRPGGRPELARSEGRSAAALAGLVGGWRRPGGGSRRRAWRQELVLAPSQNALLNRRARQP